MRHFRASRHSVLTGWEIPILKFKGIRQNLHTQCSARHILRTNQLMPLETIICFNIPVSNSAATEGTSISTGHRLLSLTHAPQLLGAGYCHTMQRCTRITTFRHARKLLQILNGKFATRGPHSLRSKIRDFDTNFACFTR